MQHQMRGLPCRSYFWLAGLTAAWAVAQAAQAQAQVNLFQSEGKPVRATMKASRKEVSPGESIEVVVQVRINRGFHVYAADGTNSPFIATTVKLTLPKGVEGEGNWTNSPAAVRSKAGELIFTNAVAFHRMLKVKPDAPPGPATIGADVRFQACDDKACFPPETLTVETTLAIVEKTKPSEVK